MTKLKLPTRTKQVFIEHRGTMGDIQVEDRPYIVEKNKFNELRGTYTDLEVPMSDMDIMLAGGLEMFFDADGARKDENWPWTGEDKSKKVVKKKPAVKRPKSKKFKR